MPWYSNGITVVHIPCYWMITILICMVLQDASMEHIQKYEVVTLSNFFSLFRSVVSCSVQISFCYFQLQIINYKSKTKLMRKKTDTHNCTWKHCEIVAQETGRVHEGFNHLFFVPTSTRTHSRSFSYHSLNLSLWAFKQLSLTRCPLAQKHFGPCYVKWSNSPKNIALKKSNTSYFL